MDEVTIEHFPSIPKYITMGLADVESKISEKVLELIKTMDLLSAIEQTVDIYGREREMYQKLYEQHVQVQRTIITMPIAMYEEKIKPYQNNQD